MNAQCCSRYAGLCWCATAVQIRRSRKQHAARSTQDRRRSLRAATPTTHIYSSSHPPSPIPHPPSSILSILSILIIPSPMPNPISDRPASGGRVYAFPTLHLFLILFLFLFHFRSFHPETVVSAAASPSQVSPGRALYAQLLVTSRPPRIEREGYAFEERRSASL